MTLPNRNTTAITGSAFCQDNMSAPRNIREDNIVNEIISGNFPDFLREFEPITINEKSNSIVLLVMKDYLCLGSNEDYVRMPLDPLKAQKVCDAFDCSLPTRKLVNDIWKHSENKLAPTPFGPPYDSSMMSMQRLLWSNDKINAQLKSKNPFALTSGHKKDVVLTNRLSPNNPKKRVAIYGWIKQDGTPIQGLQPEAHEETYSDYSHGIRLIYNEVLINGNMARLQDIFADISYSYLVSDEGNLTFRKY